MKKWKRLVCAALSAALLFTAVACGGDTGKEDEIVYGRYVETDVTPAGMRGSPRMFLADEGMYDMVVTDYGDEGNGYRNTFYRYRSFDEGATWESVDMSWTLPYTENQDYWELPQEEWPELVTDMSWNMTALSNGDLLTVLYDHSPVDGLNTNSRLLRVRLDGTTEETPVSPETVDEYSSYGIGTLRNVGDDRLYMETYHYQYDADGNWLGDENTKAIYDGLTGEKLFDIPLKDGWFHSAGAGVVLVQDYDQNLHAYSVADGSKVDLGLPLYSELSALGIYSYEDNTVLDADGGLVITDSRGAYTLGYGEDGRLEKQELMQALNYSFGSPVKYVYSNYTDDKGRLMLYLYNYQSSEAQLVRYEWDDEAIASTGKEVNVYALYDNDLVRLALFEYKVAHPEVTVSFEYALERYSDGSAMTKDDALANLTTMLLTGDGPDVLVLDDLPLQSYIDKGILEDVSAAAEGTGIYPELLTAFEKGGKLYAVPGRVMLPVFVGDRGYVEQFTDLETLVREITEGPGRPEMLEYDWENDDPEYWRTLNLHNNSPLPWEERPTLSFTELDVAAMALYELCAPAIFTSSDGVDRDALTAYMEAVKQVSDKYELTEDLWAYTAADSYSIQDGFSYGSLYSYSEQKSRLAYSMLRNFYSFSSLATGEYYARMNMEYYDEELEQWVMPPEEELPEFDKLDPAVIQAAGLVSGIYMPSAIVGVTSTSRNKDLAADFIASVLSDDVQTMDFYTGLAVTPAGNQSMYAQYKKENEWLAEQELELFEFDYEALFQSLDTPYIANSYLLETVYDALVPYCRGLTSLDVAVEEVMSKTAMYFAEMQ